VRFLSDRLLEGRATGSRGFDLAALYVATELEAMGVLAAGDDGGWLQRVPLRRAVPLAERSRLALVAPDGAVLPIDPGDVAWSGDLARAANDLEAGAAFVGHGITAPELGHDDYRGLDATGRVAVMVGGAPPGWPELEREYFADSLVKAENASAHGAIGLIVVRSDDDEERFPIGDLAALAAEGRREWIDRQGRAHGAVPQLGARLAIAPRAGRRLFAGAATDFESALATAARGEARPLPLPVRVRLETATRHEELASENVVGVVRGSDPVLRDEYVVLSAHLDHLGRCPPIDGDDVCHGAVDNAAGVATLLEVARLASAAERPPRRSLLFLFVTGEEGDLEGSDAFAEAPTVPRAALVADLNVDTPPAFLCAGDELAAIGAERSDLGADAERAFRALGFRLVPDPLPEEQLFLRNDQFSFSRRGIPSLFLFAGGACAEQVTTWLDGPYHSPLDDMRQALDFAAGARFARLTWVLAATVADRDERPHWAAGDFFATRGADGR